MKKIECSHFQRFVQKLKLHLWPRLREIHDHSTPQDNFETGDLPADVLLSILSNVVFKNNRLYRHSLFRVNYTTYDMRRQSDSVNPQTDHRDIMLLAAENNARSEGHFFRYARVLGVYHANVILLGPHSKDYQARRMDFLWVRWFELLDEPSGWEACKLDRVKFLPMSSENTFGFVNPADVVRSCHIIPSFADGKLHPDGLAMSRLAHDSNDWKVYYVNR